MTADQVAALLRLQPLPAEGGRFRRMFADQHSSAIYYLLTAGDFSALHALTGPEVYHFYAGAPVRMLLLDSRSGEVAEPVLGTGLAGGERPQLAVPAGVWQGSATTGDWSLIGTTMAPRYTDEMFTLGRRSALIERFPDAAGRIAALTRG
jgi:predicted cupin superfamily sugar epimerase